MKLLSESRKNFDLILTKKYVWIAIIRSSLLMHSGIVSEMTKNFPNTQKKNIQVYALLSSWVCIWCVVHPLVRYLTQMQWNRNKQQFQDGQYILTEFVNWNCGGPTYSFNALRDLRCGEAKHLLNNDEIYPYGLSFTIKDSKQQWLKRTDKLEGGDFCFDLLTALDEKTSVCSCPF